MRDCATDDRDPQMHADTFFRHVHIGGGVRKIIREEEGSRRICLHHGGAVLAREDLVACYRDVAPGGV